MIQHKELSEGRWRSLSLVEQLANVGSEIERAVKWKEKGRADFSEKASDRALELIDLTLEDPKNQNRLREITRIRELWADYFYGDNQYQSVPDSWRRYFLQFNLAARKEK